MRRLRILTRPIHGSCVNTRSPLDHDWLLPVRDGAPEGCDGRGTADYAPPSWTSRPKPCATPTSILSCTSRFATAGWTVPSSSDQRALPRIHLEHNTPLPDPVASRHPFRDPGGLLVHITGFNRLG